MMTKFRGKYRITSTRLKGWDYGRNAVYFITVCTKNRHHFFGEIIDGIMNLSEIGDIVEFEWLKTFYLRPDMNLWLGEYIIMPNHFHAIIGIGENKYNIPPSLQQPQMMKWIPITSPPQKTLRTPITKTNSVPNPKIYLLLFVDLKLE